MKSFFLTILIVPVLFGCSARLASVNSGEVVVANVSNHTKGDADRIADKVCAQLDKVAFLISSDKSAGTATYKCVEPY